MYSTIGRLKLDVLQPNVSMLLEFVEKFAKLGLAERLGPFQFGEMLPPN